MAIVYFDSSAFVKLLVDEEGSDVAAALWDGCDAAVSSMLAYPEVRATLAAATRDHRLTPGGRRRAERLWDEYWASTRPIALGAELATQAGQLAADHALRGADGVHLASLAALGLEHTIFAAWDVRLRAGARAIGARLAPL